MAVNRQGVNVNVPNRFRGTGVLNPGLWRQYNGGVQLGAGLRGPLVGGGLPPLGAGLRGGPPTAGLFPAGAGLLPGAALRGFGPNIYSLFGSSSYYSSSLSLGDILDARLRLGAL